MIIAYHCNNKVNSTNNACAYCLVRPPRHTEGFCYPQVLHQANIVCTLQLQCKQDQQSSSLHTSHACSTLVSEVPVASASACGGVDPDATALRPEPAASAVLAPESLLWLLSLSNSLSDSCEDSKSPQLASQGLASFAWEFVVGVLGGVGVASELFFGVLGGVAASTGPSRLSVSSKISSCRSPSSALAVSESPLSLRFWACCTCHIQLRRRACKRAT